MIYCASKTWYDSTEEYSGLKYRLKSADHTMILPPPIVAKVVEQAQLTQTDHLPELYWTVLHCNLLHCISLIYTVYLCNVLYILQWNMHFTLCCILTIYMNYIYMLNGLAPLVSEPPQWKSTTRENLINLNYLKLLAIYPILITF